MDKKGMRYIYTHIEYYPITIFLKRRNLATTQINLKGITLNELSQRKKNIILPHLYVESKTKTKRK